MSVGGAGGQGSAPRIPVRFGALLTFTLLGFIVAACTSSTDQSNSNLDDVSRPTAPEGFPNDTVDSTVPSPEALASPVSDRYTFSDLEVGGGGWVTGMVIHPREPDLMYARTDVGGAYRWDPSAERWIQLLSAETVPNPDPGDWQVSSMAIAPSDPNLVYMAVGDSFKNSEGRILVSSDRGSTWSDGGRGFVVAGNAENRIGGERLAVDPVSAETVWFGSRTEGLLVSTDGASSWSPVDGIPVSAAGPDDKPTGVKWVISSEEGVYVGVANEGVYQVRGDPGDPGGLRVEQLWESEGVPLDA